MNFRLAGWASIAEIVASIAVVLTLLLVVASMRENTNALQANTYQELMRDLNGWRGSIRLSGMPFTTTELSETVQRAAPDQLNSIQMLFLELWGIYEAAYFANERGILGATEWTRFQDAFCRERRKAEVLGAWSGRLRDDMEPLTRTLTPAFVNYVEGLSCE